MCGLSTRVDVEKVIKSLYHRVALSIKLASTHLYTWIERKREVVSCPRTQQNVPSQGSNHDHLIWRYQHTNYEATALPSKSTIFRESMMLLNQNFQRVVKI